MEIKEGAELEEKSPFQNPTKDMGRIEATLTPWGWGCRDPLVFTKGKLFGEAWAQEVLVTSSPDERKEGNGLELLPFLDDTNWRSATHVE